MLIAYRGQLLYSHLAGQLMGHLCLSISWVEDETPESPLSELSRIPIPALELNEESLSETLGALEQQTITLGQEVMRNLLCLHWDILDQQLVDEYCNQFEPDVIERDGYASQKIACRLGILHLQRQVCFNSQSGKHLMPGNALLPEHHGTIITRTLQEWACLFPQDLPFTTVERLLGWQTQEPKVISRSEVRVLVQRHGEAIRAAEASEVEAWEEKSDLSQFQVNLIDAKAPRFRDDKAAVS